MKFKFTRLFAIISIFSLLSIPALSAWADDGDETQPESFACADSSNVMDCIEKTKQSAAAAAPQSINTQQLGYKGPVSLGVRYDTDLGWIPELTYTQLFYNNGVFLQLNYGANEQRANITLGHQFTPHQQIKLTYEYLSQNLPFDFASGSVNEWVNQNAFGGAYRYLLNNPIVRSIELNGYYIHAGNKDLPDVIYYQNNDAYLNLRHIAGGTEETVTTGITLLPLRPLQISLGAGYSHLVYDTIYEDDQNTSTLAYNAGLDFLMTGHTKLSAAIANSAAETDSSIKLSQIFPAHIEAALTGQYSQGQAGQPNSTSVTLALAYPVTTYAMPADDMLGALKAWIEKPVVRSPRVLATKDQKVIKITINAVNPPAQALTTGQMMQTLPTQSIFNFDPTLFDKVVYSLSLAANSNNLADPQSQLNIAVQPIDNYNANIYSVAPLPNSATLNGAPTTYHVIITALGYKSGLVTPIQSQADLELDVNFNKNNEPGWVTDSAAINFDANDTANAINLNKLINQNGSTDPVKFYFDDPNKYPKWAITSDSGTWYLVRKPDSDGAFDAQDIGVPVQITISAQYTTDPVGATVPGQNLNITVNQDSKITFVWNNNCQVAIPNASQPTNSTTYTQDLLPCTIYKNSSGSILTVKNDNISYVLGNTHDYPGTVIMNTSQQLSIGGPTSGIDNTYTIDFTVNSKAQGGLTPTGAPLSSTNLINIDNVLNITANLGQNTYQFEDGNSVWITSVVINGLNDNKSYKITASNPSISNYTLQCSGAATDDPSFLVVIPKFTLIPCH